MAATLSSVPANLGNLDRSGMDALDYGAVKLADDGTILLYNRWESELAGVHPSDAEGKNFFTQVAPCTNNRLVFGKFKSGIESGSMDFELRYTFTYKMKPTNVVIRGHRDPISGTNWLFIRK